MMILIATHHQAAMVMEREMNIMVVAMIEMTTMMGAAMGAAVRAAVGAATGTITGTAATGVAVAATRIMKATIMKTATTMKVIPMNTRMEKTANRKTPTMTVIMEHNIQQQIFSPCPMNISIGTIPKRTMTPNLKMANKASGSTRMRITSFINCQ
jgi:hypothetical protein